MTSRLLPRLKNELKRAQDQDDDTYVLDYDESDLTSFHAVIRAPVDSLYAHTFIRLKIAIPDDYPYSPPRVHFVNHNSTRIHPNLYANGKVCLSILNTWEGPPWAPTMSIDKVLRTVQSLLDYEPMTYEPGQSDNPAFNHYVEREKWNTLLLSYLKYETQPVLREYMITRTLKAQHQIVDQMKAQEGVRMPDGRIMYQHTTPMNGLALWEKIQEECQKSSSAQ